MTNAREDNISSATNEHHDITFEPYSHSTDNLAKFITSLSPFKENTLEVIE